MDPQKLLSTAWKLRTNPFAPKVYPDGGRIKQRVVGRTLDPTRETGLVVLYHDLYEWDASELICGISTNALLQEFPSIDELVEDNSTVLILISGKTKTGTRSLRNLISYKIDRDSDDPPIFVKPKLRSKQSQEEMVCDLLLAFITDFGLAGEMQPSKEDLMQEYKMLEERPSSYVSVFGRIIRLIRDGADCRRPIVLIPEDLKYPENWLLIHESTEGLANFIIINATDHVDAEACADTLRKKSKPVVHIKAQELDYDKAKEFIRDRLSLLRLDDAQKGGPGGIAPFSDDSLETLYEAGINRDPDDKRPIEFPVGEISETLAFAIDTHLGQLLNGLKETQIKDLEQLNTGPWLIQSDVILEVRKQMNKGKRYS